MSMSSSNHKHIVCVESMMYYHETELHVLKTLRQVRRFLLISIRIQHRSVPKHTKRNELKCVFSVKLITIYWLQFFKHNIQ